MTDRWMTLAEVAAMLGLSERTILELESRGLPLRRVTPKANPIVLESELLSWIRHQPRRGESLKKHTPA